MEQFSIHLIMPNKVYEVNVEQVEDLDSKEPRFRVKIRNPQEETDSTTFRIHINALSFSEYLNDQKERKIGLSFKILLSRILHDMLLHRFQEIVSQGHIYFQSSYKEFFPGENKSENETQKVLTDILKSWIYVYPQRTISFEDIFVSTNISETLLRRAINLFIAAEKIKLQDNEYSIETKFAEEIIKALITINKNSSINL